ncbi:MAG: DUF2264 domain-containing protein [Burkholderiaceae bacterium]|nr:DUF2264 domain-containing protein [Burkholderiaceae bacterium]
MTGFAAFRSASGALADYPGPDSSNGPGMDRLEGFSRIAPLAAAWMHGGRDARLVLADGSALDLASMLRSGLLAGTDPASTDHWGRIEHWGLAIVEAGDIALALWLSRAQVWDRLNPDERHRIASWLLQVNDRRLPDNNWHLFVAKVNAVLASLGAPSNPAAMLEHYERAKTFYRGQGWFRDGVSAKTPGFDYYNAWAFHYELQWLRQIAPALDSDFIDAALRDFVAVYKHFIAPAGVPMLGRSTCYRMAAPTPLVFAQARHPDIVSPGQARRALDAVWTHFIGHGAVQQGNVTPGYFGSDLRLVEPYSGPASCLWSLRSLVAAFVFPDDHPLWISAPEPLPVELKDFHLAVGPTGWQVIGDRATGVVTLETGCDGDMPLQRSVTWDRWLSLFAAAPRRPSNVPAKYQRARFSSISPYNAADGVVPSRWGRR